MGALPTCCTLNETKNQKTMKKISLQTKLEDCHIHQRYINTITMGSKKTISDLIYSQKYELRKIRGVGKNVFRHGEIFSKYMVFILE